MSEMEQGYQKRVLAMASAKAKENGKTGDLDSLVAAIKVNEGCSSCNSSAWVGVFR